MKFDNYTFKKSPRDFYLKTTYACDIYSVSVEPCPKDYSRDWSYYVTCAKEDKEILDHIAKEIKDFTEKNFKHFKFEGAGKYYYVSMRYPSTMRKIKIHGEEIPNENSTYSCRNNYFVNRGDAENLLNNILDIFRKYGIPIEQK